MLSQWPLKKDHVRFKSCVGNREDASAWLESIPKGAALTLSDDDFRMACILRLGLRFPEIEHSVNMKKGSLQRKCICCSKNNVVDDFGHHFAHGCGNGGGRTKTHDALVKDLFSLFKELGYSVEHEVTIHSLPSSTPTNSADEYTINVPNSKLRADLVIRAPIVKLLDVTVTDPIKPSLQDQPFEASLRSSQSQADLRGKEKVRKYVANGVVDGIDRVIIPLAFDTFGMMNKVGFDFIYDSSKVSLGKGYPSANFRAYWFQRLSCTLQRNLGVFFKSNLAKFRGDWKSSGSVPHNHYEEIFYRNVSFPFQRSD
jgi:hypothetical protein